MMRQIWTVFLKEVIDHIRDRRTQVSSLIGALLTPLLLIGMIVALGSVMNADPEVKPLTIPVQGAGNAPALIEYLKQNGALITEAPANAETAVREGELDLVLVIPETYAKQFANGEPAEVRVVVDVSRTTGSANRQRVEGMLRGYSQLIGNQRLLLRGVNPSITRALQLKQIDLSTPESNSSIFLYMLPYILIMAAFTGGMSLIIDTTAGERERGSLEPLLINPIPRSAVVLGKMLASIPYAILYLVISLVMIGLLFNLVPIENYLGIAMRVDFGMLWSAFWLCFPMLLLTSALQMILAAFTRSYKEAQTYLALVPLLAGLPSMFSGLMGTRPTLATLCIPTFGQSLLINQMIRGETVDPNHIALVTVITVVTGVAAALLAIRLYQREKILGGG